jgi:hypothetical protein
VPWKPGSTRATVEWRSPAEVPAEYIDDWHERAAVREYEGEQLRWLAERCAAWDMRHIIPLAGLWHPKMAAAA